MPVDVFVFLEGGGQTTQRRPPWQGLARAIMATAYSYRLRRQYGPGQTLRRLRQRPGPARVGAKTLNTKLFYEPKINPTSAAGQ